MSEPSTDPTIPQLRTQAETTFGQPPETIEPIPGADGASFRLSFPERTVVASLRADAMSARREADLLNRLSAVSDDVPKSLGVDGAVLFQSDVGARLLSQAVLQSGGAQRQALAEEAVASLLRMQRAAEAARLDDSPLPVQFPALTIPALRANLNTLGPYSDARYLSVEPEDLLDAFRRQPLQFSKGDARAARAALDADGKLRWFGFARAGLRHGAQDLAALIADETWPFAPDEMEGIVRAALDADEEGAGGDAMAELSICVTLQCLRRFALLVAAAQARGWLSRTRILATADIGLHPGFMAHLCRVGAHFGAQNAVTDPIAEDFDAAQRVFEQLDATAA